MQTSLATITGTMLTPGVSKNNRLYTKEAIGKGVQRMRERLSDPDGLPIVMRTHHDAGDDSRKIVGNIVDVWQEADGSATYKAKLYNNESGRDIAPLIAKDENGKSALKTTSIHGYWVGPTERHRQQNGPVETGDDLEINAIDFTYSPGVTGAQIHSVTFESTNVKWPVPGANIHDGYNIFESMTASVVLDEEAKPEIAQHITVDGKSLREFMVKLAERDKARRKADTVDEHYITVCVGDSNGQMLEICADNLSPEIVKKAIKRAGALAKNILANNSDGSMDVPDDDDMVDDADCIDFKVVMASAGDSDVMPDSMDSTGNGGYNSTGESVDAANIEESAMTETQAAAAAPVGESIDYDKIGAAVATAVAETLAAMNKANKEAKAAKKAAESAKAVTAETKKADEPVVLKESITPEQLEAKLVEEREKTIAELRETLLKDKGIPQRQGFRTSVNENDTEELKGDDLWNARGAVWAQAAPSIFGVPAA